MADPKKTAALVLAFGGKKKPDKEVDEVEESGNVELETAMSELSTALKGGNAAGAATAFRAAFDICNGYED